MNYKTVKRFDVGSVCKIAFFIDLLIIIVLMIPLSLISLVVPAKEGSHPMLAFLALVISHPIIMTVFVGIAAGVYNLIAQKVGGIKVEIE